MAPENSNAMLRPVTNTQPAADVFRMTPRSTPPRVMHAPERAVPDKTSTRSPRRVITSAKAADETVPGAMMATPDDTSKPFNVQTSLSSSFLVSSPGAYGSSSWTDISMDPQVFIDDIFNLDSPPQKTLTATSASRINPYDLSHARANSASAKEHQTKQTSSNSPFLLELDSTSGRDIPSAQNIHTVQIDLTHPQKFVPLSDKTILRPNKAIRPNHSPGLLKFATDLKGYTSVPDTSTSVSINQGTATMDPIMNALNSLQQDKSRLEHELASANEILASSKDELAHTKAALASLKDRYKVLNELISDIAADRDSLRHKMDSCATRIDGVKLSLVELKGDVYVARREIEDARHTDKDIVQRMHELDKELHSKIIACDMLQSKLDEKSGLLVEERGKVMTLEENFRKLAALNESLVKQHSGERLIAIKSVEDRIQSVQDNIFKFESILTVKLQEYTSAVEIIRQLSSDIQSSAIESRSLVDTKMEHILEKQASLQAVVLGLQDCLQKDVAELLSQTLLLKTENDSLKNENKALGILIQDRDYTINACNTQITALQKEISNLQSSTTPTDAFVQVKNDLTAMVKRCETLLSEKLQLEQQVTEISGLREESEVKLAEATKLLEKEKIDENQISEQSRIKYESELARREIHVAQLTRDFEMEKANLIKSYSSKVERVRLQLEKTKGDKASLEKLLQAETDLRTRSEDVIQRLNEDVVAATTQKKAISDELDRLRASFTEVSTKLKGFEDGRPNVVLSVPIYSVPRCPSDDSEPDGGGRVATTRSLSCFESKSDSTQDSAGPLHTIFADTSAGTPEQPSLVTDGGGKDASKESATSPDIANSKPAKPPTKRPSAKSVARPRKRKTGAKFSMVTQEEAVGDGSLPLVPAVTRSHSTTRPKRS